MRLIATMGASGVSHKHQYIFEGKSYESELSFLALAEANNITDIVVIGTEKSKESIQTILDANSNIEGSKEKAREIEKVLNKIIEDRSLEIVEEHLLLLKRELQKIQNLVKIKESQTLLNVSEYFLKKDILLHSVTLLYEAMVAFLDEKIKNNLKCKKERDTYRRRNCLKKSLGNCKFVKNIIKCKEFSEKLREVDKLRNTSAHAHTTGTYQEDLKDTLEESIKIIKPIMAG